jgi:hypothetical protein
MAVTIKGKTTALRDRNQRLPGMAMMVVAADGMSSTVVFTAIPMPMARAAAMTICTADPAVTTGVHHGFLGSGAVSPAMVGDVPLVELGVRCTSSMAGFSVDMAATGGGVGVVVMVMVLMLRWRPSQNQACAVRRGLLLLGLGGGQNEHGRRDFFFATRH